MGKIDALKEVMTESINEASGSGALYKAQLKKVASSILKEWMAQTLDIDVIEEMVDKYINSYSTRQAAKGYEFQPDEVVEAIQEYLDEKGF